MERKLVLTTRMPIRWGDMDAYGHVNNTVYFRYMEQARIEWLEAMGYRVRLGGQAPVIVNARCTFLAPLTYPGTVDVRVFAGAPGRSSFETYYEMRVEGNQSVAAEGAAKVVWTDTGSGRPVVIPDPVRALLS